MTSFHFVSSILIFVAAFGNVQVASAADYDIYVDSVIAYGVSARKVGVETQSGPTKRVEEERCIFSPIFRRGSRLPDDYRGWSISSDSTNKYPLPHLQKLKSYLVLDEKGARTDIRYDSFDLVWNGYPNYFVGSTIPKQGCGTLLLVGNAKEPTKVELADIERYLSILEKEEKELFSAAICSSAARKVVYPSNAAFDCKKVLESADLSKKTPVQVMFDGTGHYLVRSYMQPHALFLFKVDTKNTKLVPLPGFVGLGDGERFLHLEYQMYADVDSDGINEVIVKQHGWEWSGFGYLKKQDDYWK